MLAQIVQFCLSQRLFVLLAALMVGGAGGYAFHQLPIDAFPDVFNELAIQDTSAEQTALAAKVTATRAYYSLLTKANLLWPPND